MKTIVRMGRWTLVASLSLLVVATLVLMQAGGVRAWSGDPTANTAISTASYDQAYPQLVSDGSGGSHHRLA
jgi:hypothetical protein